MRFLLPIIFVLFYTSLSSQITLTTSIGLAEDYCTDPGDPNNCFNVPTADNSLTYFPGVDGDYLVSYLIENNSPSEIVQISISDTKHGLVLPLTTLSIPVGSSYFFTKRFDAVTIVGNNDITATVIAQNTMGSSSSVNSNYVLNIVGPEVTTAFGVARKKDLCPSIMAASCPVPTGVFSVTVGATDTIVTRFEWTNSGLGQFDLINIVDQDGVQFVNTGFDQEPGQTLISSEDWVAPNTPGTYEWSQKLTITDKAGNTVVKTVEYDVIVEAPEVSVEFGVGRKADLCPNISAPSCPVPVDVFAVTVGAADTLVTRFAWTNTGLAQYDHINIVDQDGFQFTNTGFDQVSGQTLISAQDWVAPDTPGTYNWSQKLTITDQGGNVIDTTINYTVTVDCGITDIAPPIAICKDTTIIINPGQTISLNPNQLNGGSMDGCGPIVGGSIDKSTLTCADIGENVITLTVEDANGNTASCTSIVTLQLGSSFVFTAGPDQEICTEQTQLAADVPSGESKPGQ